jgi:hypothetical protein
MYYLKQSLYCFQGTHLVFMFKEHTLYVFSRNILCVYIQGTYSYAVFKEHLKEHMSNGSIPLSSYETASNDPHGE